MERFYLFICDGIFGYFFQVMGYVIMIYAMNKSKLNWKKMIVPAVCFAVITYGIRHISIISYGLHTILISILFILVSVLLLKQSIFPTVIGTLSATILVLLCEIADVGILSLTVGTQVLKTDGTVTGDLRKAIYGIPINIMLVLIAFIVYKVRLKPVKETTAIGGTGK